MDNIKKIFLVLVFCLFLYGCKSQVEIKGVTIDVEVPKTPAEFSKGLMFRENLGEKEGMLFIFKQENRKSFWMKNTLIPLDIIFIDLNLTIIDIQKMVPCEKEPCRTYPSSGPALYALEVNLNFTDKFNISEGDKIKII